MPEVTYTTVMNLPQSAIWDFVEDMNNWAPFLTGYVSHEIKTDTHSVWTLKGDVGMLSRTVNMDVNITEWAGPDRVEFTLKGLNEAVDGGGTFTMRPHVAAASGAEGEAAAAAPLTVVTTGKAPGFFKRLLNRLFDWFYKRKYGAVERQALTAEELEPDASELSFRLQMDAGGAMGPMVNAMLAPLLMPAAKDLGDKIAAHLEGLHGRTAADRTPQI